MLMSNLVSAKRLPCESIPNLANIPLLNPVQSGSTASLLMSRAILLRGFLDKRLILSFRRGYSIHWVWLIRGFSFLRKTIIGFRGCICPVRND